MLSALPSRGLGLGLILTLLACCTVKLAAATANVWINPSSGAWRTPSNWASNTPPDSTFGLITITNGTTKTVTIDAATPAPNLDIQKLTISAPAGSTNTLLLDNLTTNQPLRLSGVFTLGNQGVVEVINSALYIDPSSGAYLNITAGTLQLDSGLIDLSTTTAAKIGNGDLGQLILNGGTMLVDQMQIGAAKGSLGIVTLSKGLLNASSLVSLGENANTTGELDIAGGQFIATNDLTRVGNLGEGRITITAGSADFAFLDLGDNNSASTGAVALVAGELHVTPRTTNDYVRVGNYGTGLLQLNGGTALIHSELHVADQLGYTGFVTVAGARLIVTNDMTAVGRYGVGFMTVTNSLVEVTNSSIGRHEWSLGVLTIQTNGLVTQVGDMSIGRFPNSEGHVLLEGGTLSIPDDTLWVGRGGTGELVVSNGALQVKTLGVGLSDDGTNAPTGTALLAGGTVLVSSNLSIGTTLLSTGQVVVAGGTLLVTNQTGTATLGAPSGSFTLTSGTVETDRLVLTNSLGQFSFAGGTLRARGATVANGSPFVVGDGVNPATLELLGGNYVFADTLVISQNATVTGCGTITGTVVNYGTLATNCTGAVSITITSITKTGDTASIVFTSTPNATYALEYKDDLTAPNWWLITPDVTATGPVTTNSDPNAISAARFYRIRGK